MKSPWKSLQRMESGREYYAFASHIPANNYGATPALFRGASAVRAQLADTAGLIGFSLLASPLRKQYATLSVWQDEEALRQFTFSEPHRELMSDLAPHMGDTKFVGWSFNAAEGRPGWREALQKLR